MLSSALVVVVAFAVSSLASPLNLQVPVNPQVDYGNANMYIDLVLYNVNSYLPDVVPIPDIGGPFNMKNCFFLGTEYGIRRDGDATLITTGNTVKFQAQFQMQDVGIICDWHWGLMSGKGSGTTAKVGIESAIALIMDHGQHPWLTEFLVTQMDPIKTDITGLTFAFNWLAEDMANWILSGVEEQITYVVEHDIKNMFQEVLNTMVIP